MRINRSILSRVSVTDTLSDVSLLLSFPLIWICLSAMFFGGSSNPLRKQEIYEESQREYCCGQKIRMNFKKNILSETTLNENVYHTAYTEFSSSSVHYSHLLATFAVVVAAVPVHSALITNTCFGLTDLSSFVLIEVGLQFLVWYTHCDLFHNHSWFLRWNPFLLFLFITKFYFEYEL